MLTRAGVSRRLGKSIATVRRMEGVELHATVDARGVHWFDLREVDAIAASGTRGTRHRVGLDAGRRARPALQYPVERGLDSRAEPDDTVKDPPRDAAYMAEACVWAEQARIDAMAIREERNRLEGLRREEVAASAQASHELRAAKRMLIADLEDCDERILRSLTEADVAEILALLDRE